MNKFKVGDIAFAVRTGPTQTTRPCRACNGDKKVTLILGSGEHVHLDCGACAKGCEYPTGTETGYEFQARLVPYTISGIEVTEDAEGRSVRYRSGSDNGYYTFDEDDLFAAEQDASEECVRKVAEHEEEAERQIGQKVKNTNKSYAWNATYHLREAKSHTRQAEYHRRKAVILKAKAKGGKDG